VAQLYHFFYRCLAGSSALGVRKERSLCWARRFCLLRVGHFFYVAVGAYFHYILLLGDVLDGIVPFWPLAAVSFSVVDGDAAAGSRGRGLLSDDDGCFMSAAATRHGGLLVSDATTCYTGACPPALLVLADISHSRYDILPPAAPPRWCIVWTATALA
jgi:hypothetical protein